MDGIACNKRYRAGCVMLYLKDYIREMMMTKDDGLALLTHELS
jgi:hypothetical protein